MAVRVRLELLARSSGIQATSSCLVNTGYEVEHPEILIPRRLAEFLGIPLKPPRARITTYESPLGFHNLITVQGEMETHLIDACIRVKDVNVAVAEHEREVLISDALADALGIQLIEVGRGIWRCKGDPPDVLRQSSPPEYW